MTKKLCWVEKQNGKYCKNYPLKYKDQCYMHYNSDSDSYYVKILIRLIFGIFIGMITYHMYTNRQDVIDFEIVYNTFKEYLFQISKLDKNTSILYIKGLGLLILKLYRVIIFHISKFL